MWCIPPNSFNEQDSVRRELYDLASDPFELRNWWVGGLMVVAMRGGSPDALQRESCTTWPSDPFVVLCGAAGGCTYWVVGGMGGSETEGVRG